MSHVLAACLTNGFGSSKKSNIINNPTLFNYPNYLLETNSYLYLNPVSLQKCENLWIEASFSAVLILVNDLFTVSVNS
jgi:hypothetical protein